MEFQFINNIKKINYSTFDKKENVEFKINYKSIVPNHLIKGWDYYKIEFLNEGEEVTIDFYDKANFESIDTTIIHENVNEQLYLPLVQFLQFERVEDFDDPITQITGTLAKLAYFKTKKDNQYFILYSHEEGQERTPELFTLLIDRIWQVKFNHHEFLELINNPPEN